MSWIPILELKRCRVGGGTFVSVSERELAVFYFANPDRVFVIDNTCPHAGGNLSGGDVDGKIVTCPWHAWSFDLATGVCTHSPKARVRCYTADIRENRVWVDLT